MNVSIAAASPDDDYDVDGDGCDGCGGADWNCPVLGVGRLVGGGAGARRGTWYPLCRRCFHGEVRGSDDDSADSAAAVGARTHVGTSPGVGRGLARWAHVGRGPVPWGKIRTRTMGAARVWAGLSASWRRIHVGVCPVWCWGDPPRPRTAYFPGRALYEVMPLLWSQSSLALRRRVCMGQRLVSAGTRCWSV